jgi:signal transduction histidine kinase
LKLENLEAGASDKELVALGDVVFEVGRLSLVVDQLLGLSREGSAGTIPIDVVDVVSQRFSSWEPVAMEGTIAFDMRVDNDTACDAVAKPGALEQILDNLIDNALRYTPKKSAVV